MEPGKAASSPSQSVLSPLALLGILASVFGLFALLKIKPINSQTEEKYPHESGSEEKKKLAPIVTEKLGSLKTEKNEHHAENKRGPIPYLMLLVNFLTLLAVVWYACEAKKQRIAMDSTFQQVRQQTTLQRQQLVGSQSAVITLNTPKWDATTQKLTFWLSNNGGITGTVTSFSAQIQRKTLPGQRPIGPGVPMEFTNQEIGKTSNYPLAKGLPWPLPKVEIGAWPGKEMVTLEGTYTYDNGFGDKFSHRFCFLWLSQWDLYDTKQVAFGSGGQWSGGGEECPSIQEEITAFVGHKKHMNEVSPNQ